MIPVGKIKDVLDKATTNIFADSLAAFGNTFGVPWASLMDYIPAEFEPKQIEEKTDLTVNRRWETDIYIELSNGQMMDISAEILMLTYTEDINLGYPMLEIIIQDSAFILFDASLIGGEVIHIKKYKWKDFEINDKKFKVNLYGLTPSNTSKIGNTQFIKIIASDMVYTNIRNDKNSIYFKDKEIKDISALVSKVFMNEDPNIVNIEATKPIRELGFNNLYIPYTIDTYSIIRKLTRYALSKKGKGGYIFFTNRNGIYFIPLHNIIDINDIKLEMDIGENQKYNILDFKLSPNSSTDADILGGAKRIFGFNYAEKEMNYIEHTMDKKYSGFYDQSDWIKKDAFIKTTGNYQGVRVDDVDNNPVSYFTPLDNGESLKAFGDTLYYNQAFNTRLDLSLNCIDNLANFTIGDIMKLNVHASTEKPMKYENISGKWLIKSLKLTTTDSGTKIDLKLIRSGFEYANDKYVRD